MIPLPNNIVLRSALHKSIRSYIKSSQSILIAKETYTKYTTLHDLEKPPIHFLFEVLYTLECFRRIGVCHNDLHHGNILAVFTKGRKTLYNQYTYTSQNKAKRIFYIPTSGYHPRIFDFDRSCLISKKGEIRADNLQRFKDFYQDCNDNFYRDTYKFICGFYDYLQEAKKWTSPEINEVYDSIMNFIKSCFYQQSLLLEGKVTDKDGKEIIIDKSFTQIGVRRYYYVSQPIDEYMKSPEEILFELSQMFPHKIDDKFAPGSEKIKTVPFQKFSLLKMKEHDLIPKNIFKK